VPDRRGREFPIGRFEFLQANDVGLGATQPRQQAGQPSIDVVDVESRDFHGSMTKSLSLHP
jgi:hypothetical protein